MKFSLEYSPWRARKGTKDVPYGDLWPLKVQSAIGRRHQWGSYAMYCKRTLTLNTLLSSKLYHITMFSFRLSILLALREKYESSILPLKLL